MKMTPRGIRAAIIATVALGGIGAGAVVTMVGSSTPAPKGSSHSIVADFNRGAHVVKKPGFINITVSFTPLEKQAINDKTTNKNMLTAISGLQKAITAAQNAQGATALQKQQFASLEQALSAAHTIVSYKGIVPYNSAPSLKAAIANQGKDKTAVIDLGQAIWNDNPAAAAFTASLMSNPQTLNAIASVAGSTLSQTPAGVGFFNLLGQNPAQQAKFNQDMAILLHLNNKDFATALNATQAAITASQKTPKLSAQEKQDLATVAHLVAVIQPVVKDKGTSPADLKVITDVLKDKQYAVAIRNLVQDYKAGKLPAFASVFKANDPGLLSLVNSFTSNPAAIGGLDLSASKVLSSPAGSSLASTVGVNVAKQKIAVNYMNNTGPKLTAFGNRGM
jgi:hypothetical protein